MWSRAAATAGALQEKGRRGTHERLYSRGRGRLGTLKVEAQSKGGRGTNPDGRVGVQLSFAAATSVAWVDKRRQIVNGQTRRPGDIEPLRAAIDMCSQRDARIDSTASVWASLTMS